MDKEQRRNFLRTVTTWLPVFFLTSSQAQVPITLWFILEGNWTRNLCHRCGKGNDAGKKQEQYSNSSSSPSFYSHTAMPVWHLLQASPPFPSFQTGPHHPLLLTFSLYSSSRDDSGEGSSAEGNRKWLLGSFKERKPQWRFLTLL